MFQGIAEDQLHMFVMTAIGALGVMVGTEFQAVGLLRSKAVPAWIPIATLFTLITCGAPGNGAAGLISSLPMAAGAIGLAVYPWGGPEIDQTPDRARKPEVARLNRDRCTDT